MVSLDAQQIYANFHAHATGADGLSAARDTARSLSSWYSASAATVQRLIDDVRSGWQGDAAEAAARGLAPLAENSLAIGADLDIAQDLISRQIDSFHTAAAEVRPVPAEPHPQDAVRLALSSEQPRPMVHRMRAYLAAQQANVDAYAKYRAASEYNTTNLPALTDAVAPDRTPVSITSPGVPGGDRTVSGQNRADAVATHPSGARLAPGTGSPTTEPVPGRVGTAEGPVPALAGSAGAHGRPIPAGDAKRTEASVARVTNPASAHVADRTTRGVVDRATGRVVAGLGRLPGAPTGRVADREVSRPAPPDGRGAPRGVPPAGRRTVGHGRRAGVATEPAADGATSGRMPPPAAVGPVTGRRGDADEEHRTRFVPAEDGETLFGSGDQVAPPVIGE